MTHRVKINLSLFKLYRKSQSQHSLQTFTPQWHMNWEHWPKHLAVMWLWLWLLSSRVGFIASSKCTSVENLSDSSCTGDFKAHKVRVVLNSQIDVHTFSYFLAPRFTDVVHLREMFLFCLLQLVFPLHVKLPSQRCHAKIERFFFLSLIRFFFQQRCSSRRPGLEQRQFFTGSLKTAKNKFDFSQPVIDSKLCHFLTSYVLCKKCSTLLLLYFELL